MSHAVLRLDVARAAGALFFGLIGCSSESDPPAPSGGASGAPVGVAGLSAGGASGTPNTPTSGASFGGTPSAGAGGQTLPPGTAGTLNAGGSGAAGAAGANTAGSPSAGQGGQSQAGAAGAGGTTSGGAGAGGMSGGAGTAGMGMAGAMNPPGTCNNTYSGFTNYNGNGSITFYTFQMGTMGNVHCSYGIKQRNPDVVEHTYTGEGKYFAAMNTADYKAGAACGSCVEVSGSDGRKVVVTVVDECPIATNPKCTAGHLDLSREAFRQLANESEGFVGSGHGGCCRQISWKYVPCPVPQNQNVTFRLKEPNNQYYTTVIAQDHRFPIKSLQIKGMEAKRQPDNFWIVGDGNQSPGPWHVRAVDVNDWVYEATLEGGMGGDVSSGSRAMCQ